MGKIKKYTKNKLSLSMGDTVMKFVFLALRVSTRKSKMPIKNWGILNQFFNYYLKIELSDKKLKIDF